MSAPIDLAPFRRHGGRLHLAETLFPQAPRPWLDLSTGVNPHPYPAAQLRREALTRLPDPEAVAELEALAAAVFGAEPAQVAVTPGSEAALRLLPRLIGARSVALEKSTYGGHREAWLEVGAQVLPEAEDAEAWVVVNPNNPDGRVTDAQVLLAAAERQWVIADEAFVEAEPTASVAGFVGGRLAALRSFGKFYGLPGVRLGFVVADPDLAARVRRAFGDWPVSADALAAGRAAYADRAWRTATQRRLARDRRRLDTSLTRAGLEVIGGADLFRLARADDAHAIFVRLARAGVLCRPFEQPDLLRFGLPGRRADWDRLAHALEAAGRSERKDTRDESS